MTPLTPKRVALLTALVAKDIETPYKIIDDAIGVDKPTTRHVLVDYAADMETLVDAVADLLEERVALKRDAIAGFSSNKKKKKTPAAPADHEVDPGDVM